MSKKLPALTPQKVLKFLKRHDFVVDRQSGSHMILMHPENHRRAVIPIHNKDLPKGTLLSILKMAGFTKDDLRNY